MGDADASLRSGSSPAASPPHPVVEKPTSEEASEVTPRRVRRIVVVVQTILLLAHWFLYETWVSFHRLTPTTLAILRVVFALAAVSFVIASFLAWRYFNPAVRIFYTICAVWFGLMNFGLFAAAVSCVALGLVEVAGLDITPSQIADVLFAATLAVGIYGLVNAARLRVNRVTVKLPNLPDAWRGHVAALLIHTHLAPTRNV